MTLGEATSTVSKALQGTPMLLVLLFLNAAVLAMVTWLTAGAAEHRSRERAQLVNLLDQCIQRVAQ